MKRRTFIKWGLTGLTGAACGLYSWQIEPFWLEFVHLKMPVRNLPPALAGKTLMQISDIHVGKRFDYHFLIESFKKAQEVNPDFVVYTGDFVSADKEQVEFSALQEVLASCVKGRLGTVGILGNHDYGRNWTRHAVADTVAAMLEKHGVTMLRNEQVGRHGLSFIGLDDYWGLDFNPEKALSTYRPDQAAIVLCHNPDVCDLDVWNNYQGWILAGHTHGGQCKPPFLPPPLLPVRNKRYTAGKFDLSGNRTLYINRALGHLWQVRFNVRPEITVFELVRG
ncbi:metallophosphoesterase [Hymenobacter sp. BT175]|uniref:metallophosphoesterase n=1 Tax=Hymenobacter translucens TaxID=2886507 RepID=UPI001D0EFF5E|nr:metallophosphoesterase [Hymenobacter translucens]MCC2546617.1 metallophosphoesterase [Hymenobacter translucens]